MTATDISVPPRHSLLPALRERDDRIEYLEAENAELRRLLGMTANVGWYAACRRIGVVKGAARVLLALMHGTKRREALFRAYCDGALEEPDQHILELRIHQLRKALEPKGIEIVTHWGIGYEIDEENRAAVLNVLGLEALP